MPLPRKGYFSPPVIVILALITFGVALTLFLNADLVKNTKNKQSPSPQPATQQSPDLTPQNNKQGTSLSPKNNRPLNEVDIGDGWVKYTNEIFKFSINYPKGWVLEDSGFDPPSDTKAIGTQYVAIKSSKNSVWPEGPNVFINICEGGCGGAYCEGCPLIEKKEISLFGHKATKLVVGRDNKTEVYVTEIWAKTEYNNKSYAINLIGFHQGAIEEVNQILSTFKFLN